MMAASASRSASRIKAAPPPVAGVSNEALDDHAVLLGGMMAISDTLSGEGGAQLHDLWRRRGRRAEKQDAAA